jgi:hypothetical protein
MTKHSYFLQFQKDLPGTLEFHNKASTDIKEILSSKNLSEDAKEIIVAFQDEIESNLDNIQKAYNKFITNMVGQSMQHEMDKQVYELFPDSSTNLNKIHFIKIKIIYEWTASFWVIADAAWNNIFSTSKILSTYVETSEIYNKIYTNYLTNIFELNIDTKNLLNKIEKEFNCKIVGSYSRDKEVLVSNLIFEEELNYEYLNLFPKEQITKKVIQKPFGESNKKKSIQDEYFFTEIKGTKDWNKNDSYILFSKINDLKEEEKKFYSSSFITLNPSENTQINLAAALVRKNSGFAIAPRYNKMITTLLEYATNNILKKDFGMLCEDLDAFLYHIGPVVLWNIIQEDLIRRDFGYCHFVDKNSIIKFFPENIIKKHIIDFWAEKFYDIQSNRIDSYINFSKGVSNIRESYKVFFENAASTKKRNQGDHLSLDAYLKENTGKLFGYRRAQVYRRFVNENVWGHLPEVNSIELVNKFTKNN